jgi:hypothetical protein
MWRRLLVSLSACLLVFLGLATVRAQDEEHRAGVVIQYGDGQVETACVRFSEPAISGLELLERSGASVVTQSGGVGAAVCKIGPDGCDYPAEGCFCEREGSRSIYWAFYTLDGDAWAYASLGAANTEARDGDVHGWAWGLGESGSGATPPLTDLDTICGPAAPAATAPLPGATDAPAEPAPTQAAPATQPAAPTQAAPATPAPPAQPAGQPWGYVGFVALVIILGAGAALLARRR